MTPTSTKANRAPPPPSTIILETEDNEQEEDDSSHATTSTRTDDGGTTRASSAAPPLLLSAGRSGEASSLSSPSVAPSPPSSSTTTTASSTSSSSSSSSLAPYTPTCNEAIQVALTMMELQPNDIIYDLGCGDGRLLIQAAIMLQSSSFSLSGDYGCYCCRGIDYNELYIQRGLQQIQWLSKDYPFLSHKIDLQCMDLCTAISKQNNTQQQQSQQQQESSVVVDTVDDDTTTNTTSAASTVWINTFLQDATVVYIFLLPKGIQQILPLLHQLIQQHCNRRQQQQQLPPLRIVSYMFQIHGGYKPTKINSNTKGSASIYLYQFD